MNKTAMLAAGAAIISFAAGCAYTEGESYRRIVNEVKHTIESKSLTNDDKLMKLHYLGAAVLTLIENSTFTREKYRRLCRRIDECLTTMVVEKAEDTAN